MVCFKCKNEISMLSLYVLECYLCINVCHVQCANMSKNDFRNLQGNRESWLCDECIHTFPFNQIESNEDFLMAISGNKLTRNLYSDEYLFNPFEMNDDNNMSPMTDNDPDTNYFSVNIPDFFNDCKYYNSEAFKSKLTQIGGENQLSMLHCNIRSAVKNANNLSHHLNSSYCEFDVIALSETWLNESNSTFSGFTNYNHEYNIRKIIKEDGSYKKGGGVSLLINDNIQYEIIPKFTASNEIYESIFIEIKCSNSNIIVGCIYRPPGNNISTFNEKFELLLHDINKTNKKAYIMGDYNINLLNKSSHKLTSDFVNTLFSCSFIPLINRPTRVQQNSATLIDNIFTNNLYHTGNTYFSGVIPSDVSDHFSIFHVTREQHSLDRIPSTFKKHVINTQTISKFVSNVSRINWADTLVIADVNTAYSNFQDKICNSFKESIPLKSVCAKTTRNKPWITEKIKKLIDLKNKLHVKLKIHGDTYVKTEYKKLRNRLNNLLKQEEKKYNQRILDESKNNLSKMWKALNKIINKKRNCNACNVFKHNNVSIKEPDIIANQFNNYFKNIPNNMLKNIPTTHLDPCQYMKNMTSDTLFLSPTNEEEIQEIISNLKNTSGGCDNITVALLKSIKCIVSNPLMYLFNLSFAEGIVPDILKIAKIIPIWKKGNAQLFENYRPISILPCVSKVIEKLVYKRLMNFINKYDSLYSHQFGFREGRSTEMALYTLSEKFYEAVETNQFLVGVFLDLSRAFDTLSHDILLRKLPYYGIRGKSLEWISSYLTNRKQYVSFHGHTSNVNDINTGVPQGSIIGPLLFIIYINDLPNVSSLLSFILYADDSSIFINGNNLDNILSILNNELVKINRWLQANKLTLNTSKSTYMIMCSPKKKFNTDTCDLFINDNAITLTDETKFLGIIIDNNFTWIKHVNYVASKISKGVGILARAKHLLYANSLRILYESLIKPYFTYCLPIWGGTYETHFNKLNLLQKKIVRIISRSDYYSHTSPLFTNLRIMSLPHLYKYFVSIFVFKCVNNFLPLFSNIYQRTISERNFNLRSYFCKNKFSQMSLKFTGIQIWNSLETPLKMCKSHYTFKRLLRRKLSDIIS